MIDPGKSDNKTQFHTPYMIDKFLKQIFICLFYFSTFSVLANSYEWHMIGPGKSDKKAVNATLLLPHEVTHADIVHSARQVNNREFCSYT